MEEPEDQSKVKRARVRSNTSQEVNVASSPSYVEDDPIMKRTLLILGEERNGRRGNMEPLGELVSHFPKQPQHPPPPKIACTPAGTFQHCQKAGMPNCKAIPASPWLKKLQEEAMKEEEARDLLARDPLGEYPCSSSSSSSSSS